MFFKIYFWHPFRFLGAHFQPCSVRSGVRLKTMRGPWPITQNRYWRWSLVYFFTLHKSWLLSTRAWNICTTKRLFTEISRETMFWWTHTGVYFVQQTHFSLVNLWILVEWSRYPTLEPVRGWLESAQTRQPLQVRIYWHWLRSFFLLSGLQAQCNTWPPRWLSRVSVVMEPQLTYGPLDALLWKWPLENLHLWSSVILFGP